VASHSRSQRQHVEALLDLLTERRPLRLGRPDRQDDRHEHRHSRPRRAQIVPHS
jgi:hypothetical protein